MLRPSTDCLTVLFHTPLRNIIIMSKEEKKTSKTIDIKLDEKEMPKEKSVSKKKSEFEALIKAYKKQSPVKYEMKKEVLKAKLKNL